MIALDAHPKRGAVLRNKKMVDLFPMLPGSPLWPTLGYDVCVVGFALPLG